MEQSPNGLKPSKPKGAANKKPMYIMLLVVLIMALGLMYSLTATKKKAADAEKKAPDVASMPLAKSQGSEALALPPSKPGMAVVTSPNEKAARKPLVVEMSEPKGQEDPEEKRRDEQYLAALSAPMITPASHNSGGQTEGGDNNNKGGNHATTTNSIQSGNSAIPAAMTASGEHPNGYDPASNIDKEKFFDRADTGNSGWLSRYTREAGRPLEIKTGTIIPAVMVGGINSDLPGVMIAQVSQNVYDTATGQNLLIPQGAKLYGAYDSRVIYGQERVLTAWNRVIFPDGSSVTLGAMPGADMSGYSGFNDKVNNHYIRIFGSAFLMSMITGATSYAVDSMGNNQNNNNNNVNGSTTTTFQDAMAAALAAQMGQATMAMLQKNLNIAPTLEIRPGYQFNVVATKDVAFSEPYSDQFIGQNKNAGQNENLHRE